MTSPVPHNPSQPPAGWYPHNGLTRWWDGTQWTEHVQQLHPQPQQQMMQQPPQRMDGTRVHRDVTYTRPQTGHSLTLHICLIFLFVGLITVPYYSLSPNHYWHI